MQIISLTFFVLCVFLSLFSFPFIHGRYSFGLNQSPLPTFHISFESNYYLFNDITYSSAFYSNNFSFPFLIILHNRWAHSGLQIDCLSSHFQDGPENPNFLLSLLRSLYVCGSRFFIQLIELRNFSSRFLFSLIILFHRLVFVLRKPIYLKFH